MREEKASALMFNLVGAAKAELTGGGGQGEASADVHDGGKTTFGVVRRRELRPL